AGFAGYIGNRFHNIEAIAAADQQGVISAYSNGPRETVAARALRLLQRYKLVVVALPLKREGGRQLDQILKARKPGDLVIAPQRALVEMGIIAAGTFTLGALTDRFVAWPRGPIVPAVVGLAAITLDLINDSELIVQSLLGPNPRFGSRFFGIGNEMEAALPIL